MGLPILVDPRKLAIQGKTLQGSVPVTSLSRLASAVNRVCSDAEACLQFETEDSRTKLVRGTASVNVVAECQRCLGEVALDIRANFVLQVVADEVKATNIVKTRDFWIVEDRMASLHYMVEDELLLALAPANYHELGSCNGDALITHTIESGSEKSPFEILKQLIIQP